MTNDARNDSGSRLRFVLEDLARRVPHVRSALLLSTDGMAVASCGLERADAEQLAALASGMFSIARSVSSTFGGPEEPGGGQEGQRAGQVQQVICELGGILLFVSAAGERSVLAVIAGREADLTVVGHEMSELVRALRKPLATPARVRAGGERPAGQS